MQSVTPSQVMASLPNGVNSFDITAQDEAIVAVGTWQPSQFSFPPRPHDQHDAHLVASAISPPSPTLIAVSSPTKSASSSFSTASKASSSASSSPPSSVHSHSSPTSSSNDANTMFDATTDILAKSSLHADAAPFVFNSSAGLAVDATAGSARASFPPKNAFTASPLPPPIPRSSPLDTPPLIEQVGRPTSYFPASSSYPAPRNSVNLPPPSQAVPPPRPTIPQVPFQNGALSYHSTNLSYGSNGSSGKSFGAAGRGSEDFGYLPQQQQLFQHPPTPPSSNFTSRSTSPTLSYGAGAGGYFGSGRSHSHSSSTSSLVGLGIAGLDLTALGVVVGAGAGGVHHQQSQQIQNRSPTAAELQAYFGPSSVPVNLPTFMPVSSTPSSTSITSPSADLYNQARHNFVTTSLVSLPPTTPQQKQINERAMGEHFDRAMASNEPLSVLFGLSPEMGRTLLEDEGRTGIDESVLRCARERMGIVVRGFEGPSSNNRKLGLYKTELCRSWEEKGSCRYGSKCQFAHGAHEIREVARHPKFKSEVCRTFWLHGSCPYGRRCCFIHTTLPTVTPPHNSATRTTALAALSATSPSSLDVVSLNAPPYLSSSSSSSTIVPSSYQNESTTSNSPVSQNDGERAPTATTNALANFSTASAANTTTSLFGVPFDSLGLNLNVSLKPPGRFTNNPSEVPATYQDPPVSRLQRLAGLPKSQPSLSSRADDFLSVANVTASHLSNGGSIPSSYGVGSASIGGFSTSRRASDGSSTSSFAATSPALSMSRSGSNTSVSSLGSGAQSQYGGYEAGLEPVQGNWLGAGNGTLDWPEDDVHQDF